MAGRPYGEPRGRTEEADALAAWLRGVTKESTLRELVERLKTAKFPYSRSSCGEVLRGSRLPPDEFVETVVRLYVTMEPDERLRDGLQLLEAARQADQARGDGALPSAAPRGARLGPVAQAYKDLAAAQQKNAEAWQKLHESELQRQALEKTVSLLGARCTTLEVQLERAEEGRAELELELEQLRGFRDRAGGQLEHARRLEEKAFTVHTAAANQVIRDEAVLRDLGRDAPGAGLAVFTEDQILPRLEEIEQFLEVVEERLEAQDAELDELGEGVGLAPPPGAGTVAAGPPVVPGQLTDERGQAADPGVPGQRQDSQDNAVNSENDGTEQRDNQGLLDLLETAQTPVDLARSFKHLDERDGSLIWLTEDELAAKAFGDAPDTAQRWAAQVLRMGRGMPMTWEHLAALVTALDATPEEVNAFERAYDHVRKAHSLPTYQVPPPSAAIPPKDAPPAAGPEMPPESTEAGFDGLALLAVGIIVVSIVLIVIGQFQRAPETATGLTAAGWWFTSSGLFLLGTLLISLSVRYAGTPPVARGDTDDQTYGYPPMG
uniref:hypothetical protein n=1 Tax=Streptomyces sp. NBC_01001 TaxID=2903713 RepID=UPI002F917F76